MLLVYGCCIRVCWLLLYTYIHFCSMRLSFWLLLLLLHFKTKKQFRKRLKSKWSLFAVSANQSFHTNNNSETKNAHNVAWVHFFVVFIFCFVANESNNNNKHKKEKTIQDLLLLMLWEFPTKNVLHKLRRSTH